ncbi:hypothetical protein OZX62_04740 [Bifidobacterium sp. ESL0690]|uniref:glycoside hydrolase family 65 protein n=1 Tax=Bifidobacterium sp. ESL0690 TaxID=2983214 RepID=UPI0023F6F8B4|nr:glycosyl hydrolase family 65 protein [Bifidobacterium sp. ESL0690]WEV47578.1 hypothetical protein OZX62_04740 [Bifidobacterium sp. ESL0690]
MTQHPSKQIDSEDATAPIHRGQNTNSDEWELWQHLPSQPMDEKRYPIDPWKFVRYGSTDEESATLFSLSNGCIGVRGDSGKPRGLGSGTFLNGFHETSPISHNENAHGYSRVGQTIQGVPDVCDFRFSVDGRELSGDDRIWQEIDFKKGSATRFYKHALEDGACLEIDITTMVCLFRRDLMTVTVRLRAVGADLHLSVEAPINVEDVQSGESVERARVRCAADNGLRHLDVDGFTCNDNNETYGAYHCVNSGMAMAVGFSQFLDGISVPSSFDVDLRDGVEQTLVRYASYNSQDIEPVGIPEGLKVVVSQETDFSELVKRCAETLRWARGQGERALCSQQEQCLSEFWDLADISIEDDSQGRTEQILRWELFQLAQATMFIPNGVSAKGMSGTGYSGHYFWDTETYILPFLAYTFPERARDILSYRFRMLPAARKRAKMLDVNGALFPWRTIDGEEASGYFVASTAQYHIDADIAYAVCQYTAVSGDREFLAREGVDLLVETARMWASLGFFGEDGAFHINTVTGPDEYTVMVNDNYYTNAMAQFNLRAAARALDQLDPDSRLAAGKRLSIGQNEPADWLKAADAMKLPYDPSRRIHLQDADVLSREPWNGEGDIKQPLFLHYHPINVYRRRILKQTDTVLALYLLSSQFDIDAKRRDFDFYDPLTIQDSSLSASSQAIIAAEVGYEDLAMQYFRRSLYADVANLHRNTRDGIHLASAGGVWLSVVAGFGGFRDSGGCQLSIDPHLPPTWRSMTYRLKIRGSLIEVWLDGGGVKLRRLAGSPVSLLVEGESRQV